MPRVVVAIIAIALVVHPAGAQRPADTSVLDQGQQLYQEQCALCHQQSGSGDPPAFPALSGNDRIGDPLRLLRIVRLGMERMPSFPGLTADEIAALANYVGSTWASGARAVTTEEAAAILEEVEPAGPMVSVWDGLFTQAQTIRGEAIYPGACGWCHGHRLNGAPDDPDMRSTPPLARARFLRVWEGRSLASLFEYTRATMPEDNPDSMTEQEYVDVIAYMLSVSGVPTGDEEFMADLQGLAHAVIHPQR
jgi:mono/diheme cytochrome c family protein